MRQRSSNAALTGVRVVELGQLIAGPFCGQLLGDLGADVIKIEPPGAGDPMRQWGRVKPGNRSLWWPIIARNKKCATLDVRTSEGQHLFRSLAATADIVVENLRPGTLERWNLGYDNLSAKNPGLILVRVSGYGQTGPYSNLAGYGSVGEAMGGLRYVTGPPDADPSRVGVSIGDSLAAVFATVGALAALNARHSRHYGQVVDCAIYESVLAIMESIIPEYDTAGHVRERSGSILPNIAPSNLYPTKDGKAVIIGANQDSVFRRLARVIGRSELASDPRFSSHDRRGRNQEVLDEVISEWTVTHSARSLVKMLRPAGVAISEIYRVPDMLADPHFQFREAITKVKHPELGPLAMQNIVPRLSGCPGGIDWCGPELGQDNDVVFRDILGLCEREYQMLVDKGVI